MGYRTSGDSKMIVQYEWILGNVDGRPQTFASKMISFRGEKVFRVCLKNLVEKPVLCVMAINLNKMGMKVEQIVYGTQGKGIGPATMSQMREENTGDNGNLQLFKTTFVKQIIGNCTFVFRISIEGSVPGFSYRLSDRLAKNQLAAASKGKYCADVEFVVKGKTVFSAHKAILAARSKVFEAEFRKEQPVEDGPSHPTEPSPKKRKINSDHHQIHIDDVDPSTVEQFLYFVYTGEPMGLLANEQLLILAIKYQIKTLSNLCKVALKKVDSTQMVKLMNGIHDYTTVQYSLTIRPDKDTEIFFDRTTPTFQCCLSFEGERSNKSKSMMRYQNENIFFVNFTGEKVTNPTDKTTAINKSVINFSCSKHRKFGLKIEDVYCMHINSTKWIKIDSKHCQKNAELLQHFSGPLLDFDFPCISYPRSVVSFDVKIVSTIDNYYYEMMDGAWMNNFWFAATNQKFTDVEIFVGTVKVMEAHRVILSARSTVMNAALNRTRSAGKSVVKFGAEFDVDLVKCFLKFMYTGLLESSAKTYINYEQLLKLASKYNVWTLKDICTLANNLPDNDQFTSSLLEL